MRGSLHIYETLVVSLFFGFWSVPTCAEDMVPARSVAAPIAPVPELVPELSAVERAAIEATNIESLTRLADTPVQS
jgi:hypothetical protein